MSFVQGMKNPKGNVYMKSKIYLNQIGYISHMPKSAAYTGTGSFYQIIEAVSGKLVYSGTIPKPVSDEASGDNVSQLDFSTFNMYGKFFIRIGRRRSCDFIISAHPYKDLKNALIKGMYYNRCGKTHSAYAGEYAHEACHTARAFLFEDISRTLDVSGGWHDGGNYCKYVTTACTQLGHMLYAYQLFAESFAEKISIPESGNNMPDILNECKTELLWLLKMQARDGGVYHKVGSLEASRLVLPEDDKEKQYVFPRSHEAAAYFTAVMALSSRIYRTYDSGFAGILQDAAFKGWIWLTNNPVYEAYNNPSVVRYVTAGDRPVSDGNKPSMFWAAAELYSLSGDKIFHDNLAEAYDSVTGIGFTPQNVSGFGVTSYVLTARKTSAHIINKIKRNLRIAADNLYSLSQNTGYKAALSPEDYIIDSNMKVLSDSMLLILSYKLLDCEDYIHTVLNQLNYLLGKNAVGTCFVTGFGNESVYHPHHRLSAFDEIEAPVPGLVVNGPNRHKDDDFAKWNIPHNTPPAKSYIDSGLCYSANETASHCGSAAVFVTAFLDALEKK